MNDYKQNAIVFKAFCDENRLRIIEQLTISEKCGCDLLESLPINQSTISHHMKILVESEMVHSRKEGKWVYYSLSETGIKDAKRLLEDITRLSKNYSQNCKCDD